MSSLRVTDVSEFYAEQGGGVRTYVHQKLALAKAHGVTLSVIVPGAEDAEEERSGGRIVRVRSPKLPLDPRYHVFVNERAVQAAIARTAPDVLEASSPFGGGLFVARYEAPVPRALVLHQDASLALVHALLDRVVSRERLDRWARPYFHGLRHLAGYFDETVVSGAWLRERLSGFGVPRVTSVPFGIDKRPFSPTRFDAAMRAHLLTRCEVPQGASLLVAVSRHHPEKRLFTLIDAFARASEARGRGSMGLVIFGDGPLASLVRGRAARVPGIFVAGYTHDRDELARVLASADLFVHGSAAETYGIVLAEAICSGLPFVAPSFGGAVDLAHEAYASLYEPGDAAGCARAITEMLARDRRETSLALADARATRVRDMDLHFTELFARYGALAGKSPPRLARRASVTVSEAPDAAPRGTPRSAA